jgi:hypothetical protein
VRQDPIEPIAERFFSRIVAIVTACSIAAIRA